MRTYSRNRALACDMEPSVQAEPDGTASEGGLPCTVETISSRIARAQDALGLTGNDVALEVGVMPATYRSYRRGGAMPPADVLGRIALALGVSSDWLLGLDENLARQEPAR